MNNSVSAKQQVYDNILKDFFEGKFEPGIIFTEKMMSERYDVSRVSVREALIELCKDNYFKSLPRLGYTPVTYTIKEMMDLCDFRLDLELSNMKRIINNYSKEKLIDKGTDFIKGYPHPLGEGSILDHWKTNAKFHLDLCSLSGNNYTYAQLERCLNQSFSFFKVFYQTGWNNIHEHSTHAPIIDALFKENFEEAYKLLEKDITSVQQFTFFTNKKN